jgi:hypothetical protein
MIKILHGKFWDWVLKVSAFVVRAKIVFTGATINGKYVIIRSDSLKSRGAIAHELVHVDQIKRLGLFTMRVRYYWQCIKVGYYDNPFEVEARAKARTIEYLARAEDIISEIEG